MLPSMTWQTYVEEHWTAQQLRASPRCRKLFHPAFYILLISLLIDYPTKHLAVLNWLSVSCLGESGRQR